MNSLRILKFFIARVEKHCSSGNKSKSPFKLASVLTFSVIS